MSDIVITLWFDGQAEEAADFYCSVFPDAEIAGTMRNTASSPGAEGGVVTVDFTLLGQSFVALNGGPQFTFSEAISLRVPCADQEEVDHYWSALTDGGEESMCGWLKDRYGVSWQVVPTELHALIGDPDPERADRAVAAMLQMRKIDLPALRRAADGDAG